MQSLPEGGGAEREGGGYRLQLRIMASERKWTSKFIDKLKLRWYLFHVVLEPMCSHIIRSSI